ncbi:hypothetical protein MKL09_09845 [Methylobacterium sp. J-048]|uniref:hypothetical protein n=1 Tax=Methylobacterium sp. J-048 TaxID=2836635 RepID=UPI001FBAD196|nr:hypothetical protein [Methylobacterium sp. J-048]MCJ2056856.1 hypothetical protein [Methylobacterium sp. J-048]
MQMTADCLDRWLGSFDNFRPDFLDFCWTVSKSLGFEFEFSQDILRAAHEGWAASHDMWLAERMGSDTSGLSHIKIMGLLLHQLCRAQWVKEIREYKGSALEFNGTAQERDETAKDFLGGPEAFFSLQFVLQIINWFEAARQDKTEPFNPRMTEDMAHDLMFYLVNGHHTEVSSVLILKGLYIRD